MQNLDKNILIQNIKSLMDKNNMKQEHLAKAINVGQPSISKCLTGKQSISIDLAFSIAQYFGVTLDDLCKDPNQVTTNVSNSDNTSSLHPAHEDYLKACEGLAAVFKYSSVLTMSMERQEVVYAEETSPNGYDTGYFVRQKGIIGGDPVVKYNTVFFPKYHEVETQFSTPREAEEYFSELRCVGNDLGWNMRINEFLDKLADLNRIYQNGSITKDAYFHAIDSNLEKIRE